MRTQSDSRSLPAVHVVDDSDALREGMVRSFCVHKGVPAVGYATGEAFLDAWRPDLRGVVVMDIELSPRGEMNGDKVFDRLMALRSHLPVVFHTGPFGHHTRMGVDLVRRRPDVEYCAKDDRPEDVEARILQFFEKEPALYEKAVADRWLLQLLAIEMTHGERQALEGTLSGKTGKEWAQAIGGHHRTLEFLRKSALERIPGLEGITGPSKMLSLAMRVAPLMEQMGATGALDGSGRLTHLAAIELGHRLRLLDEPQQVALQAALRSRHGSSTTQESVVESLGLMAIKDIPTLRDVLKTGGQEMLGYLLPMLKEPYHRRARHWLTWVATRPSVTAWEQIEEPPDE